MKTNPDLNKSQDTAGTAAVNQKPANLCSGCIYNQHPESSNQHPAKKWLYNGANRLIAYYLTYGWLEMN